MKQRGSHMHAGPPHNLFSVPYFSCDPLLLPLGIDRVNIIKRRGQAVRGECPHIVSSNSIYRGIVSKEGFALVHLIISAGSRSTAEIKFDISHFLLWLAEKSQSTDMTTSEFLCRQSRCHAAISYPPKLIQLCIQTSSHAYLLFRWLPHWKLEYLERERWMPNRLVTAAKASGA